MSRLAVQHQAVNLAQGFPDFSAPDAIKAAARDAITEDRESIFDHLGRPAFPAGNCRQTEAPLRPGVRSRARGDRLLRFDEGMIATLLAVTNPGDEIIIFEPFYEN